MAETPTLTIAALVAIVAIVAIAGTLAISGQFALPAPAAEKARPSEIAIERAAPEAPAASATGLAHGKVPVARVYVTGGVHTTSSYVQTVFDTDENGVTTINDIVNDAPIEKGTVCIDGYCS
ncbi:MAG: hypothetical protein ACE5FW_02915 [Candidatus Aenigmatarchaeota archaeon]